MLYFANDIIIKFPTRTFYKIIGESDYQSTNEMMKKIYRNIATLQTSLEGNHHRLIRQLMKPTLYTPFSATVLTKLTDQSVNPTTPQKATPAMLQNIRFDQKQKRKIF